MSSPSWSDPDYFCQPYQSFYIANEAPCEIMAIQAGVTTVSGVRTCVVKFILVHLFHAVSSPSGPRMPRRESISILSTQTMHVEFSSGSYTWPVSTARAGYSTPRGYFAPDGTAADALFQKIPYVANALLDLLPWRLRYSWHLRHRGARPSPASHGCVRLSPGHAGQPIPHGANRRRQHFDHGRDSRLAPASHGSIIGITRSSRACAERTSIIPPMPLPMRPTDYRHIHESVKSWQASPDYMPNIPDSERRSAPHSGGRPLDIAKFVAPSETKVMPGRAGATRIQGAIRLESQIPLIPLWPQPT